MDATKKITFFMKSENCAKSDFRSCSNYSKETDFKVIFLSYLFLRETEK